MAADRILTAGQGAATDRVTRTMALALGVAAVLLAVVGLPEFTKQLGVPYAWWTWGLAVGMFVPPVIGAAVSPFAPTRVLRVLAAVSALTQLGGLILLLPALPNGVVPTELGSPWVIEVAATGTTAAAVAWRPRISLGYLGVCVALIGVDRYFANEVRNVELAFQDALHSLLFDLVFVALAIATYRAGRKLDAAADAAVAETRTEAATRARFGERTRVEALLHDSVLVALLASSRGSSRAAGQARDAIAALDRVDEAADDEPLPSTDWVWRLQALTTDLAPDARFSHDEDAAATIPPDAARAVLEATAEAVRNSVVHAGRASRAVHATVTDSAVEVTVLDDGAGFDPATVRPGRLGVSVSILDRMRAVPGGRAAIVSRLGVGTRVSIAWTRVA